MPKHFSGREAEDLSAPCVMHGNALVAAGLPSGKGWPMMRLDDDTACSGGGGHKKCQTVCDNLTWFAK